MTFIKFLVNAMPVIAITCTILIFILGFINLMKEYHSYKDSKYKIYKLGNGYGYMNHLPISLDSVKEYRELPKNKNIYYNAALLQLNNYHYNPNHLFGAIILQWVKDKRINIGKNNEIYLTKPQQFENEFEKRLFVKLQKASKNNVLEEHELIEWVKSNYYSFYDLLMVIVNDEIKNLTENMHIKKIMSTYVMDDKIYNDSLQVIGLMKYLTRLSNMDEKELKEVYIWEDYLIYANLFGIADKVNEQLQFHYPNLSQYTSIDALGFVLGTLIIAFMSGGD